MKSNTSGNVLFLILIAVALFAALSYVITTSQRGSSGSIEGDKGTMAASHVLQQLTAIRAATLRLNLSGIPVSVVDYSSSAQVQWNGTPALSNVNPNCSSDSCRVFSSAGIPYVDFTQYSSAPTTTGFKEGHLSFRFRCVRDIGTDLPDLVIHVRNLDESVCKAINKFSHLDPTTVPADLDTPTSFAYNNGSFLTLLDTACSAYDGDVDTTLRGKTAFCKQSAGGSVRTAYLVLLER